MTDTTTGSPRQLTLPGQSHTAEGPHDQTGMYVMHFGFRRDLAAFLAAVPNTPVGEAEAWAALEERWMRFSEVLHHHHTAEDEHLWPRLRSHAEQAGNRTDLQLLDDMEAEHAVVDPALEATRRAFSDLRSHPCADHRNALEVRVVAVREVLDGHLAHEEGQALPMLQRTLTVEENAAFEKAISKAYPLRVLPYVLCWALHELPDEARQRLMPSTPPGYGLLERVLRRRFLRLERRAFRFA
jgi:hypothetical protein